MLRRLPLVTLAAGLLLAGASTTFAQDSAPTNTGLSTLRGAYTEAQARKGEETFRRHCSQCHAPEQYTGEAFRKAWSGRSVFDLFELIRTTMPNDRPGRLSRGQYAEILAYLFRLNGFPPGEKALPSDDEPLQRIRIEVEP